VIKRREGIKSIIGLDLSIISSGLVKYKLPIKEFPIQITVGKGTDYGTMIERLAYSSELLLSYIDGGELVFMEGYSYGSFNTEVLAQLGGIIKTGIWQRTGIAPIIVSPNTLKKFILGSGKGQGKEDIKLGAYKKWKIEAKTSDVIDAYALARLGLQTCGFEKCKFEYEEECIKALTKGKKLKKGEERPNPNTLELLRAGVLEDIAERPARTIRKTI